MDGLKAYLFGNLRVQCGDESREVKLTHSLKILLAFLLLKPNRLYARDYLSGLFWGDESEEHARGRLNTAIWRLRRCLESETCAPTTYLFSNETGEFGFNWDGSYWIDHAIFEDQITHFLALPAQEIGSQEADQAEATLKLYTSDLLDEFHDEWVLRERENMRLLYLRGVARLMQYYTNQNLFEQSIACGQHILGIDPLQEEIHRELIRLYLVSGQRPLAVNQYKICRDILRTELNIEPMQETKNLYDLVLAASRLEPESSHQAKSQAYYKVLKQFNETLTTLNNAQMQLKQAIKMLEEL